MWSIEEDEINRECYMHKINEKSIQFLMGKGHFIALA
jgi:hypothetical protein